MLGGHGLRDRHCQIGRNEIDLGMIRVAGAGACDALTHMKLAHAFADRDHRSCERVAERRQGIELVHGLLVGGHEALLAHGREDLFHLIRARAGLAEVRKAALANLHAFGAARNHAEVRSHEDAAGFQCRWRDFLQANRARLVVLADQFHADSDPCRPHVRDDLRSYVSWPGQVPHGWPWLGAFVPSGTARWRNADRYHIYMCRTHMPLGADGPWQDGAWRRYYAAA